MLDWSLVAGESPLNQEAGIARSKAPETFARPGSSPSLAGAQGEDENSAKSLGFNEFLPAIWPRAEPAARISPFSRRDNQ